MNSRIRWLAALALTAATMSAQAAALYHTESEWLAALVPGSMSTTQTFEGFGDGANLRGVHLGPSLPAVSLDTNADDIRVIDGGVDGKLALVSNRGASLDGTYIINFAAPVAAFAFEVKRWDATMHPTAMLVVDLVGGGSGHHFTRRTAGAASDAYFIGLIAVSASPEPHGIKRITWTIDPGIGECCMLSALDNFRMARVVPLPAGLPMALVAALPALWWRRRLIGETGGR